jgi:RHS repeat-associated protein
MSRIARVVIPGLPHHVTQRGNRRMKTFFCENDYEVYMGMYYRHRACRPGLGRFLSRDPGAYGNNIAGNLYDYVYAAPLAYVDPHGLACEDEYLAWKAAEARRDQAKAAREKLRSLADKARRQYRRADNTYHNALARYSLCKSGPTPNLCGAERTALAVAASAKEAAWDAWRSAVAAGDVAFDKWRQLTGEASQARRAYDDCVKREWEDQSAYCKYYSGTIGCVCDASSVVLTVAPIPYARVASLVVAAIDAVNATVDALVCKEFPKGSHVTTGWTSLSDAVDLPGKIGGKYGRILGAGCEIIDFTVTLVE